MRNNRYLAIAVLAVCLVMLCVACDQGGAPDSGPGNGATTQPPDAPLDLGEEYPVWFPDFSNEIINLSGEEISPVVLEFYYNALAAEVVYQYDLESIELDPEMPFGGQPYFGDQSITWHDYFYEEAVKRLQTEIAISYEALAAGITLSDEDEEEIRNAIAQWDEMYSGDKDEILKALKMSYGQNVTPELHEELIRISVLANRYRAKEADALYFTEEEALEAVPEELFDQLDYQFVNVRHVLTTDYDFAVSIMQQWREDPTEEHFMRLAEEFSEDEYTAQPGMGGLYENVWNGEMVEEFNDWCFDEAREPGDVDVVTTEFGHHVMYFVGWGDYVWLVEGRERLKEKALSEWLDKILERYPITWG